MKETSYKMYDNNSFLIEYDYSLCLDNYYKMNMLCFFLGLSMFLIPEFC